MSFPVVSPFVRHAARPAFVATLAGVLAGVLTGALVAPSTAPLAAQSPRPAASAPAAADTAMTPAERAAWEAEEARYDARARALRDRIVAAGTIRAMGTDACNPGALRVFDLLEDPVARARVDRDVWELERLVLVRGLQRPVNDERGHALMATVMRWESGDERPRWDADVAEPPRAVPPGLMGEFPDPQTGACIRARELDTLTFWLPAVEKMPLPGRGAGPVRKVYFGPDGVDWARREFFTEHGADTSAILEYVRLAPVIRWREWGLVAVERPAEKQGAVVGAQTGGSGGASYLFRWVAGEWRLVAIVRTWG
jgi:hypothetical protein